jgi:hypothetical protein
MSILGNFEELCEKQDNTIEFRLYKYAVQDKNPIVLSNALDFLGEWYDIKSGDLNKNNIYIKSNMMCGRRGRTYIYLAPRYDMDTCTGMNNYFKNNYVVPKYNQNSRKWDYDIDLDQYIEYFIGSFEDGFEGINTKQYNEYTDLYSKTWGEEEADKLKKRVRHEYIR